MDFLIALGPDVEITVRPTRKRARSGIDCPCLIITAPLPACCLAVCSTAAAEMGYNTRDAQSR